MFWRGVKGEDLEERKWFVEEITRKTLDRITRLRGVEKRKGEAER